MLDDVDHRQLSLQDTNTSPTHSIRSVATQDGLASLPEHNTYASRVVMNPNERNDAILAITDASNTPVKPAIFRSRKRRDSFSVGSDVSFDSPNKTLVLETPIELQPKTSKIIGGLPEQAWQIILGMLVDEEGVLNQRQKQAILRYGRDRRTLHEEAASRGKADSVQTWKVLEAMGCLSYDEVL